MLEQLMAQSRRLLGITVLQAAEQRISQAFDAAGKISASFSGGKDSTVLLHLVMEEAIRRDRRVGVLFVDMEAQYQHTIAHIQRCYDRYAEHIDPYWIALPLNLRNAVSVYEPQWTCFDPSRRESWVREPPSMAVTDPARFDWFRPGMEFEELVPLFAEWYAGGEDCASFVGIRSQESLNRWRTIVSTSKTRVNDWPWSTRKAPTVWNAYPIYDWKTEDIWVWHARNPGAEVNEVYTLMHRAGLTIHQARLCQPYGDDQRKGLWLYHLLEPATWARVVARVNGANQGALYAREAGNILGNQKVTRPEGHTWESYAELMLASMPKPTAEHYRAKVDVFLQWWVCRGYEGGIPDEADPKDEAKRRLPSWRRVCKTLLRNDYWCKGLSFSQHKSSTSYARYRAITDQRRHRWTSGPWARWQAECGTPMPWGPTHKQLAMLAAVTGGRTPAHAWKTLAKAMGVGVKSAKRDATRAQASAAIEALKTTETKYREEATVNAM